MNTTIYLKEVLLYYDTPQLFVAIDDIRTNYLCMLVEQNKEFDIFVCVQVSKNRLESFCSGLIDLKSIFISPEIKRYYKAKISNYQLKSFEIIIYDFDIVPDVWLPDEGVYINLKKAESEIFIESKERAKTIIYLNLNPSESASEPRINALSLSEALLRFQTMVKYAYKKAILKLPYEQRKQMNFQENYLLDVFAFSPGSFKVKLQSQSYPNLFGETEVIKALQLIDQLIEKIDDVNSSLPLLLANKGHFANTYINFLKYIADSKNELTYTWAFSSIRAPVVKHITSDQAQKLYDFFYQQEELKEETIELVGYFEKVDEKYGKWRLVDQGKNAHSGELGEIDGLSLKGIVIGTILYRLLCTEKIIEVVGTNEERKIIQLIKVTEFDLL
jgi:hypothetical protein